MRCGCSLFICTLALTNAFVQLQGPGYYSRLQLPSSQAKTCACEDNLEEGNRSNRRQEGHEDKGRTGGLRASGEEALYSGKFCLSLMENADRNSRPSTTNRLTYTCICYFYSERIWGGSVSFPRRMEARGAAWKKVAPPQPLGSREWARWGG